MVSARSIGGIEMAGTRTLTDEEMEQVAGGHHHEHHDEKADSDVKDTASTLRC
jgi:hypothetical protein